MDAATANPISGANVLKQVGSNEYDGLMLWCNYCRLTTRHKTDKKSSYATCLVCHERRRFYWRRK